MTDAPTSYFRYEEVLHGEGYTDQWGEWVRTGSHVTLQLREYKVIKVTPQGVRLDDYSRNGRLVLSCWNKQWAAPTIEEARQSFIARKKRQVRILEAQLDTAKEALGLAETGKLPGKVGWLSPRPDWARATDPTAEVAQAHSRELAHQGLQDWVG